MKAAIALSAAIMLSVGACSTYPEPTTPTPTHAVPTAVPINPGEPWIVFEWYWTGDIKDLSLMREDGSDAHPIGNITDGLEDSNPEWSPDGNSLAYEERTADDAISIWVSNADGTHAKQVAKCASAKCRQLRFPAWSHDGKQLALVEYDYLGEARAGTSLQVLDLASGAVRTLSSTDILHSYSDPDWSNDDSTLAFSIETYADTGGDPIGDVVATLPSNADNNGQPTTITPVDLFAGSPNWHPTKNLIAFGSNDPFNYPTKDAPSNIYTVNADGSALKQLTTLSVNKRLKLGFPSWSSDGALLIITELTAQQTAFFNSWSAILAPEGGSPQRIETSAIHGRLRPLGQ
jgi:Tol biopolymer transport system component